MNEVFAANNTKIKTFIAQIYWFHDTNFLGPALASFSKKFVSCYVVESEIITRRALMKIGEK